MFGSMIAMDIAKLEMEHLDRKIERLRRAGLVRGEGERQLLTDLAAVGSRVLLGLGSVLIPAGKSLSDESTSGRTVAA